ncbi:MAG TPA: sugar phosphate isomerase/epimerase [Gemmatimonadaceae bacterium]
MHRRELLKLLGVAAASPFVPRVADVFSRTGTARHLDAIGIQLYTVRSAMDHDVERTLAAIAEIGYTQVEFAGLHGKTPREMRAILDRYHLTSPSTHIDLARIRTQWPSVLAEAVTLGQRYVICPWLDADQRRTLDDYRRVADELNRAGEIARKAGITIGYHNHNFEFAPIDGAIPYDILLAECDLQLVAMELDLFWIVKGGQDPLTYFTKYPGRFPLVHVKDMTKTGDMVDVGKGSIDFRAIFAQSQRAGIRYAFVEHDDPPSPLDSARASYEYLERLTF